MSTPTSTPMREMTPREKAEARFFTAAESTPPTDEQKNTVAQIKTDVVNLAERIYAQVPPGVCRSKALTELNTTAMWAIRGVFDDGRSHIN